jgi:SUKH superfamily protein
VDFAEFDRLVQPLRARSAAMQASHGFVLIDARTASAQELLEAEQRLGTTLPSQYKTFMMHYGGGQFGSIDLLPITPNVPGREDVVSVSKREDPAGSFVAIAPVGTGDYWGFPVTNGQCINQVWIRFHDTGDPEPAADDFLTFVANRGLTV